MDNVINDLSLKYRHSRSWRIWKKIFTDITSARGYLKLNKLQKQSKLKLQIRIQKIHQYKTLSVSLI